MKNVLSGDEFSQKELHTLLTLAGTIKNNPLLYTEKLQHKHIALIFDKPSLRTRASFIVAVNELGGKTIEFFGQMRKTETPQDLIRVLQGYCQAVVIRTFADRDLEEMCTVAKISIINALTDNYHPCQILADLLTLKEHYGECAGLKIAYLGDGNNILHSLLLMAPKLGIHINYCCPEGHTPASFVLEKLQANDLAHIVQRIEIPQEAVKNCHAVYTDVWTSMGFDKKDETLFAGYQVNEELMKYAEKDAVFMHCMPMNRGKEVSPTLPDHSCSVIFQQSSNRLYAQKALLVYLFS